MNQLLVQARDRIGNVFARVIALDSGDAIRVASRQSTWSPGLVVEIIVNGEDVWPCVECGAGNLDMLADACRLCGGDRPA